MEKNLKFVPSKFIKKRLPLLFLALLPSLTLDVLFIAGFIIGKPLVFSLVETVDIKATLYAIAANFILFKSWIIIIYLRIYHSYRRSIIKTGEKGIIYRKFRLMGVVKTDWKNGYGFYYDHYLIGEERVVEKKSGAKIFYGNFKVVKKAYDTEAFIDQYNKRRVVIPGFFEK